MATSLGVVSKYLPGSEVSKPSKSKKKGKNKKTRKLFPNQQNKRAKAKRNSHRGGGPADYPTENDRHNFATFQRSEDFQSFHNPYPPDCFAQICPQTDDQTNYIDFHKPYPPDRFEPVCLQPEDQDFNKPFVRDCMTENQNNFQMFHNPYPPDPMHLQMEDVSNNFCVPTMEDNSDLAAFHNPYPPEISTPKLGLLPTPPPDKYIPPTEQAPYRYAPNYPCQLFENATVPPPPPIYYHQPPPPSLPPPPLPPPPDEPPPPSPPETFHCPFKPKPSHQSSVSPGLLSTATIINPSAEPSHQQVSTIVRVVGSVNTSVRPVDGVGEPTCSQVARKKIKLQASSCVQTKLHIKAVISTNGKPPESKRSRKLDARKLKETQRRERKRNLMIRMKHEAKYKKMRKQEGAMLRKNPYVDLEEMRLVTADISIKSIKVSTGPDRCFLDRLPPPRRGILVSAGFRETAGAKDGDKKVGKTVRFVESEKPADKTPGPRVAPRKRLGSRERKEKAARKAARLARKGNLAACALLPPPPPPSFEPPPCLRLLAAREAPSGLMWARHKYRAKRAHVDELIHAASPHPVEPRLAPPPPLPPPPKAARDHHGRRNPAGFALPLKFPLSRIKSLSVPGDFSPRAHGGRGPQTPPPPPPTPPPPPPSSPGTRPPISPLYLPTRSPQSNRNSKFSTAKY